ncbi:MAG: hypothetical protein ABIJ16_11595 [Bacteroidota bacterium]
MEQENHKQHLDNLTEIRSIMEQSSRFISLSGLSGVSAGICALLGAIVAFWYFDFEIYTPGIFEEILQCMTYPVTEVVLFMFADAAIVFILALSTAILFTTRKAKKQGLKVWNKPVKKLLWNLFIPVVAGGFFCIGLLYRGAICLVAPATLIFYGLGLVNAGKYTLRDIKSLGISEIVLGLIAVFIPGYSLLIWAIGFGVLHIVYGVVMYYKYDYQK